MKTPRLRFFGVECTIRQIFVLQDAAGAGHDVRNGFYNTMPKYFSVGAPFTVAKMYEDEVQPLIDKGFVRHDKKKGCKVWTLLGIRYATCAFRNNKHIHVSTWQHDNRLRKRKGRRDVKGH